MNPHRGGVPMVIERLAGAVVVLYERRNHIGIPLPRRPLEKRPVVAGSKPASSKTSFGLNLNRFYWQSWPQPV